ncbi:Sugar or nucleoside kinase, ribokinase family [Salimicrobium flavidum]|uniref:Sugar or nucleoside kinase, ribokinase family n=2 Tax=Salimicrobium flavidum TaxID=570947 RepID=A0A1N7J9S3_9BACI|nr:Sugar or nucleoside kinase, ribokinase family [Salimicrobium flavidum]
MKEHRQPIVCVGGANVDKKLYAKNEIAIKTSNPVSSSTSVGGVARNIAENLGRLGEDVVLLTARGDDADWLEIKKSTEPYVDLSYVFEVTGASTGSYTAVLDPDGDLSCAYADMDIFDSLTMERLKENTDVMKNAKCIIADLNCPAEAVHFLKSFASEHDIPFLLIPVSSPKMGRLPPTLEGVEWLIVNIDESETSLGMNIDDEEAWGASVERWLEKGVQQVIVTGGKDGVMAGKMGEVHHFPSLEAAVTDVTGAGDSFCGAVIHSWLSGGTFEHVIQAGLVNARKTIMSKTTVREDLTETKLKKDREEFFNGTIS